MKFTKTVYGDDHRAVILLSFEYYLEEYLQGSSPWFVTDTFWSLEKQYYGCMSNGAFFII